MRCRNVRPTKPARPSDIDSYPCTQVEGRLLELRLLHGSGLVDASGLEEALDLRPCEAVDKALKRCLHKIPVHVLRHRRDEIVRLAVRLRPLRDAAVEKRLELTGDREVVNRRAEHDGVRPAYLLDDRVGIVLDDALPELLAGVAAGAEPDLLVLEPDDLGLVARGLHALRDLLAERVGVGVRTERSRYDQHVLCFLRLQA